MAFCRAMLAHSDLEGELDQLENVAPERVISQPLFFPLAD